MPELLGALVQLDVPARMDGKPIDAEAVRDYLAGRNGARQPRIHDIAILTARYFSLKLADLRGSVAAAAGGGRPRRGHVSGAVSLPHSLQQIGLYFGGRDHTTVMHSCRKIEAL